MRALMGRRPTFPEHLRHTEQVISFTSLHPEAWGETLFSGEEAGSQG